MPSYVEAALLRFLHLKNGQQKSPHPHVQPTFGAKVQYTTPSDDSPILSDERLKYIQQVVEFFLHYGIFINNTILVGLGAVSAEQSVATVNTTARVDHLMNYLSSHPNVTIHYHASRMVIFILSDDSYLSVEKSQSRASGVYVLSDPKPDTITFTEYTRLLGSFVHILCKLLRNIMALAAEVKNGALSSMAKPPCPSEKH